MNYELIIDEEAIRFLEKQERNIRRRIFSKLQQAKKNPQHYFQRLEGRLDYKLRVGHYRVIADITANKIMVTLIRHRKDVYKR
ncbi:type II toxin-antitoxin system RelE/ParE family toxin [Candidatus Woesearchaeota archaeon]|nr:type II toxin-antitoxin system RelE/ParE family toxin [Candidatus Woesearchaeota archaeon]